MENFSKVLFHKESSRPRAAAASPTLALRRHVRIICQKAGTFPAPTNSIITNMRRCGVIPLQTAVYR